MKTASLQQNQDNMSYIECITVMYHKANFIMQNADKIKQTTLINEDGSSYHISDDSLSGYINLKEHVDYVITKLDPVEREFINNEFLKPSNTSWWSAQYSKSTYYRMKNKTVNKFLRLYQL